MNRFKEGLVVSLVVLGFSGCNSEQADGVESEELNNKSSIALPNAVVSYANEELGVGGFQQTEGPTIESWENHPNTEMPYDPAEEDETVATAPTSANIRSRCETTEYTLEANPREIVLYDIDGNYSWPGAILQGKAYRNGSLKLISIDPDYRSPTTVVVSNLYTESNSTSKTIEQPTYAQVSDAIKGVIAEAFQSEIPSGSNTTINISKTKDLETFFMKAGFSGKTNYGLGKVKADLTAEVDLSEDKQTLVIQLTQKMFDVEIQQPPKPQDWFTADFFSDELPSLIDANEIGLDNPAVYVSKVTYGRMLTATISSTVTSRELEAIIKLSYDSLTTDGTVDLNTRMKGVYDHSTKSMTALGGNNADASAALSSGDWNEFFKADFEVTEAVPMMISFKNLYDNSPAGTTETSTFTDTICEPYLVVDGAYDFQLTQAHDIPDGFSGANDVKTGQFNSDDIVDLIWNNATGSDNQVYVTTGSTSGKFSVVEKACVETNESETLVACELSNGYTNWSLYHFYVNDFNGDGFDDLIWIHPFANNQSRLKIRYVLGGELGFDISSFAEMDINHGLSSIDKSVQLKDINGNGKSEIIVSSNVYALMNSGVPATCEGSIYKGWHKKEVIYKTTWTDGIASTEMTDTSANLYCSNDLSAEQLTDRSRSRYVDFDANGKLDQMSNMKGVSIFDSGAQNNLLWARKISGLNYGNLLTLDTDNRSINYSGHSLKDAAYWLSSIASVGNFNSLGASMVWLNFQDGSIRGIFWDNATQQWYESTDDQDLFDWTAFPGVTDLTNSFTEERNLVALDINDDQFDDLTFYTSVEGDSSAFENELWLGTALSSKQQGGPTLFNSGSVGFQKHPVSKDWSQVTISYSGKFDSDSLDDIVFIQTGSPGKIYVARAKSDDM